MEIPLFRLFFILIVTFSFAFSDLAYIYRTQGIDAVKVKLEDQLKQKEYWQEYLLNKDTKFGYYESKQYIIYCEKQTKRISLYKNENNKLFKISDNSVIVGKKFGDKQKEGDLKTPEGVYDLTSKITKLDSFYGPLALVTSYPNTFDKAYKKNGSGIWIHGMPLDETREEFTKGCIALDNPELTKLEKSINFNQSILLISDNSVKDATKDELSSILSLIYLWKDAWKKSDIDSYLSFYSKDFKKSNGGNFESFKKYKTRIFSKKEDKSIKFSNINISLYPNSINKRVFQVIMDEDYSSTSMTFNGKKELYIEIFNNKTKILVEG